ncbi:MAG: SgcJ/EcaC family oxidoreductase [Sphingomonadaceae bacterium]|nr:SgcJ/EcaC family oxidoreductase [Sphingomonadaceae bacterium]
MTEDERAIRELIDDWMAATRAGDVDTVLGLMTDDVVYLVPGRAPFGKREFAEQLRAMADVEIDGHSEIEELHVLGDWAFLRDRFSITVTPGEGEPVRRSGYTLTIMRKCEDGQWRLARDANLMTEDD